ncbi:MAG: GTPase domain-containing protein [Promethearchaeota archaeon]
MPEFYSTPKYVTVDLFGKVGVGKTTIFEPFAGDRFLKDGGNLSYDYRTYYARCWVLERRWDHTMVFLTDPKLDMRWKDLRVKHLQKLFEPTNVLIIVTDSTKEDVQAIKKSFSIFPRIKKKLIIFVIANMQDIEGRLPVDEIKTILEMKDVLGLNAKDPKSKDLVEKFIEEGVIRYFTMVSKRGQAMMLLDDEEIGFGSTVKEESKPKKKFSARIEKLKQKLDKQEESSQK